MWIKRRFFNPSVSLKNFLFDIIFKPRGGAESFCMETRTNRRSRTILCFLQDLKLWRCSVRQQKKKSPLQCNTVQYISVQHSVQSTVLGVQECGIKHQKTNTEESRIIGKYQNLVEKLCKLMFPTTIQANPGQEWLVACWLPLMWWQQKEAAGVRKRRGSFRPLDRLLQACRQILVQHS